MGIIAELKGELVDIIEWLDDSRSTLACRFPRYENEIKNGAELIAARGSGRCSSTGGSSPTSSGPATTSW
jgi:membrane protease subunit (stomatin/prohibitin family)